MAGNAVARGAEAEMAVALRIAEAWHILKESDA